MADMNQRIVNLCDGLLRDMHELDGDYNITIGYGPVSIDLPANDIVVFGEVAAALKSIADKHRAE